MYRRSSHEPRYKQSTQPRELRHAESNEYSGSTSSTEEEESIDRCTEESEESVESISYQQNSKDKFLEQRISPNKNYNRGKFYYIPHLIGSRLSKKDKYTQKNLLSPFPSYWETPVEKKVTGTTNFRLTNTMPVPEEQYNPGEKTTTKREFHHKIDDLVNKYCAEVDKNSDRHKSGKDKFVKNTIQADSFASHATCENAEKELDPVPDNTSRALGESLASRRPKTSIQDNDLHNQLTKTCPECIAKVENRSNAKRKSGVGAPSCDKESKLSDIIPSKDIGDGKLFKKKGKEVKEKLVYVVEEEGKDPTKIETDIFSLNEILAIKKDLIELSEFAQKLKKLKKMKKDLENDQKTKSSCGCHNTEELLKDVNKRIEQLEARQEELEKKSLFPHNLEPQINSKKIIKPKKSPPTAQILPAKISAAATGPSDPKKEIIETRVEGFAYNSEIANELMDIKIQLEKLEKKSMLKHVSTEMVPQKCIIHGNSLGANKIKKKPKNKKPDKRKNEIDKSTCYIKNQHAEVPSKTDEQKQTLVTPTGRFEKTAASKPTASPKKDAHTMLPPTTDQLPIIVHRSASNGSIPSAILIKNQLKKLKTHLSRKKHRNEMKVVRSKSATMLVNKHDKPNNNQKKTDVLTSGIKHGRNEFLKRLETQFLTLAKNFGMIDPSSTSTNYSEFLGSVDLETVDLEPKNWLEKPGDNKIIMYSEPCGRRRRSRPVESRLSCSRCKRVCRKVKKCKSVKRKPKKKKKKCQKIKPCRYYQHHRCRYCLFIHPWHPPCKRKKERDYNRALPIQILERGAPPARRNYSTTECCSSPCCSLKTPESSFMKNEPSCDEQSRESIDPSLSFIFSESTVEVVQSNNIKNQDENSKKKCGEIDSNFNFYPARLMRFFKSMGRSSAKVCDQCSTPVKHVPPKPEVNCSDMIRISTSCYSNCETHHVLPQRSQDSCDPCSYRTKCMPRCPPETPCRPQCRPKRRPRPKCIPQRPPEAHCRPPCRPKRTTRPKCIPQTECLEIPPELLDNDLYESYRPPRIPREASSHRRRCLPNYEVAGTVTKERNPFSTSFFTPFEVIEDENKLKAASKKKNSEKVKENESELPKANNQLYIVNSTYEDPETIHHRFNRNSVLCTCDKCGNVHRRGETRIKETELVDQKHVNRNLKHLESNDPSLGKAIREKCEEKYRREYDNYGDYNYDYKSDEYDVRTLGYKSNYNLGYPPFGNLFRQKDFCYYSGQDPINLSRQGCNESYRGQTYESYKPYTSDRYSSYCNCQSNKKNCPPPRCCNNCSPRVSLNSYCPPQRKKNCCNARPQTKIICCKIKPQPEANCCRTKPHPVANCCRTKPHPVANCCRTKPHPVANCCRTKPHPEANCCRTKPHPVANCCGTKPHPEANCCRTKRHPEANCCRTNSRAKVCCRSNSRAKVCCRSNSRAKVCCKTKSRPKDCCRSNSQAKVCCKAKPQPEAICRQPKRQPEVICWKAKPRAEVICCKIKTQPGVICCKTVSQPENCCKSKSHLCSPKTGPLFDCGYSKGFKLVSKTSRFIRFFRKSQNRCHKCNSVISVSESPLKSFFVNICKRSCQKITNNELKQKVEHLETRVVQIERGLIQGIYEVKPNSSSISLPPSSCPPSCPSSCPPLCPPPSVVRFKKDKCCDSCTPKVERLECDWERKGLEKKTSGVDLGCWDELKRSERMKDLNRMKNLKVSDVKRFRDSEAAAFCITVDDPKMPTDPHHKPERIKSPSKLSSQFPRKINEGLNSLQCCWESLRHNKFGHRMSDLVSRMRKKSSAELGDYIVKAPEELVPCTLKQKKLKTRDKHRKKESASSARRRNT